MTITVATGYGLRNEIESKVIGFSGDIQILNYQPNATYDQVPVEVNDSVKQLIANRNGVTHIQAVGQKAGIIKTDELFEGAVLKGVDSDYDWNNLNQYLKSGRTIAISDTTYNDSILITQTLANRLEVDLNDRVSMYFVRESPKPPLLRRFYISGIFQTDFEEIDKNFVIGDLKHIQRLNGWDSTQVGSYEIFIGEETFFEQAKQIILLLSPWTDVTFDMKQLQAASEMRHLLPYEMDAMPARLMNEQLFQWLDLFDINIRIVIIIMIVVATINMSIALLIFILERTQMIGIMMALGSNNQSIRKIFLINAGYLILRGLFWGNLIGIGLCLLQQQYGFIKLDPETYYVSEVSINLNVGVLLLLNGFTLVVCLVCMVLPSFLITRISPVKAIRFD